MMDATRPIHPRDWQIAAKNLAVALASNRVGIDERRMLERRLVRKLMAELSRRDAQESGARPMQVFR